MSDTKTAITAELAALSTQKQNKLLGTCKRKGESEGQEKVDLLAFARLHFYSSGVWYAIAELFLFLVSDLLFIFSFLFCFLALDSTPSFLSDPLTYCFGGSPICPEHSCYVDILI